jgi:formylmethanofuran dehydrogenase subunit E
MPRILILIALCWLVYLVIRRVTKQLNAKTDSPIEKMADKMVQCAQCGVHIPETDSIQIDNKTVCKNQPCIK